MLCEQVINCNDTIIYKQTFGICSPYENTIEKQGFECATDKLIQIYEFDITTSVWMFWHEL